jgi:hypothetical protein
MARATAYQEKIDYKVLFRTPVQYCQMGNFTLFLEFLYHKKGKRVIFAKRCTFGSNFHIMKTEKTYKEDPSNQQISTNQVAFVNWP